MIKLTRVRTKGAIPAKYRGEKRIEQVLKLLVNQDEPREFETAYWKNAKKQLKLESGNKCAYCEASTALVAHGDVEHFRPKSIYWWLAYCYDNYLYSCQICNQTYKGDKFPLEDETQRMVGPSLAGIVSEVQRRQLASQLAPDPVEEEAGLAWTTFQEMCNQEGCHLLNPYVEDPEPHFRWEADAVLKEVTVQARVEEQPYWQASVECYGLNREELKAERWKVYRVLRALCLSYFEFEAGHHLRTEIEEALRTMMDYTAPFAGMCRFVIREEYGVRLD